MRLIQQHYAILASGGHYVCHIMYDTGQDVSNKMNIF